MCLHSIFILNSNENNITLFYQKNEISMKQMGMTELDRTVEKIDLN